MEGLILSVPFYFSIKSCAQPLLVVWKYTLSLETDYYAIYVMLDWCQNSCVMLQFSCDATLSISVEGQTLPTSNGHNFLNNGPIFMI